MLQIFVSPDPADPDRGVTMTFPATAAEDPTPEKFDAYVTVTAEYARSQGIDVASAVWWARR